MLASKSIVVFQDRENEIVSPLPSDLAVVFEVPLFLAVVAHAVVSKKGGGFLVPFGCSPGPRRQVRLGLQFGLKDHGFGGGGKPVEKNVGDLPAGNQRNDRVESEGTVARIATKHEFPSGGDTSVRVPAVAAVGGAATGSPVAQAVTKPEPRSAISLTAVPRPATGTGAMPN